MKTRVVLAFAPSLLGLFLLNCSDPALCEGPQCAVADGGPGTDATVDDGGPRPDGAVGDGGPAKDGGADGSDGTPPTSCNTSADVSSQPACVADAYAVFVNGMTGSDLTGNGTKENAFKSIGKGVASASSTGRVFICATTYTDPVKLTSNVSLYGGFDCSGWAYSTNNVPKVAPSMAGFALDLESVSGVTVEDLEFDSQTATAPGGSSAAVFADNATSVSFRRVTAKAGNAGPQPDAGTTPINYSGAMAPTGTMATGSAGVATMCPQCLIAKDMSSGGLSGSESGAGSAGLDGGPEIVGTPGGAGGTYSSGCVSPTTGAATKPAAGGVGALTNGALTSLGWTPTPGSAGGNASVAQGGGGGAGSPTVAGSGGGCGGCGGAGGTAGAAGGSSFAVLSFDSSLSFTTSVLSAGSAANGATGGDGEAGQPGGFGGPAQAGGCPGANGGLGGPGGGGGGGAAGISVAIGYAGSPPTVSSDSTLTFATLLASGGGPGANGSPVATMGVGGAAVGTLDLGK